MPTYIRAPRKAKSRSEHDDMIIAQGQIEIINLLSDRFARAMAWFSRGRR